MNTLNTSCLMVCSLGGPRCPLATFMSACAKVSSLHIKGSKNTYLVYYYVHRVEMLFCITISRGRARLCTISPSVRCRPLSIDYSLDYHSTYVPLWRHRLSHTSSPGIDVYFSLHCNGNYVCSQILGGYIIYK